MQEFLRQTEMHGSSQNERVTLWLEGQGQTLSYQIERCFHLPAIDLKRSPVISRGADIVLRSVFVTKDL